MRRSAENILAEEWFVFTQFWIQAVGKPFRILEGTRRPQQNIHSLKRPLIHFPVNGVTMKRVHLTFYPWGTFFLRWPTFAIAKVNFYRRQWEEKIRKNIFALLTQREVMGKTPPPSEPLTVNMYLCNGRHKERSIDAISAKNRHFLLRRCARPYTLSDEKLFSGRISLFISKFDSTTENWQYRNTI